MITSCILRERKLASLAGDGEARAELKVCARRERNLPTRFSCKAIHVQMTIIIKTITPTTKIITMIITWILILCPQLILAFPLLHKTEGGSLKSISEFSPLNQPI